MTVELELDQEYHPSLTKYTIMMEPTDLWPLLKVGTPPHTILEHATEGQRAIKRKIL